MSTQLTPNINIEVEEGTDYFLQITYNDPSTGLPVDITNYSAELFVDVLMGDAGSKLTLSTVGGQIVLTGAGGIINLAIPGSSTIGFGQFMGPYNLYLISPTPDFVRTKLSKGFFTVIQSVFG